MDEVERLAAVETQLRADEGKAHAEDVNPEELAHRAEHIGMAAIKYYLLKFTPRKSFEYDPKESIDFLGQTGPYCLFNYARTRSLLRRQGGARLRRGGAREAGERTRARDRAPPVGVSGGRRSGGPTPWTLARGGVPVRAVQELRLRLHRQAAPPIVTVTSRT